MSTRPTPGPWDLEEIPYETNDSAGGWYLHLGGEDADALYMSKAHVTEGQAGLIVAACNACQSINPDNPHAVAEALPDLVAACTDALRLMDTMANTQAAKVLRAALAKLEAK